MKLYARFYVPTFRDRVAAHTLLGANAAAPPRKEQVKFQLTNAPKAAIELKFPRDFELQVLR